MRRFIPLIFLALTGCGFSHYPAAQTTLTEAESIYRLSANDVLFIRVFDEPELSGKFNVDSQGMIAMPLVGKISVRGQTEKEAAQSIESALQKSGILRAPRVAVEIKSTRPVFVMGEVKNPGEYAFKPGMTVYQAVAVAGGYTYRADRDDVGITRQNGANIGSEKRFSADEAIPVLPGDVIEIGERYF